MLWGFFSNQLRILAIFLLKWNTWRIQCAIIYGKWKWFMIRASAVTLILCRNTSWSYSWISSNFLEETQGHRGRGLEIFQLPPPNSILVISNMMPRDGLSQKKKLITPKFKYPLYHPTFYNWHGPIWFKGLGLLGKIPPPPTPFSSSIIEIVNTIAWY